MPSQSTLSRDLDSKNGDYRHYGMERGSKIFRGTRRDGLDSKRWVNDRKIPRDPHCSSFELGNNENGGDGIRVTSNPLLFPCQLQAVFVGFDSKSFRANELESAIEKELFELNSKASQWDTCNDKYTVYVVVNFGSDCVETKNLKQSCPWKCDSIKKFDSFGKLEDNDAEADELLQSMLGPYYDAGFGGRVYSVVVV